MSSPAWDGPWKELKAWVRYAIGLIKEGKGSDEYKDVYDRHAIKKAMDNVYNIEPETPMQGQMAVRVNELRSCITKVLL